MKNDELLKKNKIKIDELERKNKFLLLQLKIINQILTDETSGYDIDEAIEACVIYSDGMEIKTKYDFIRKYDEKYNYFNCLMNVDDYV